MHGRLSVGAPLLKDEGGRMKDEETPDRTEVVHNGVEMERSDPRISSFRFHPSAFIL
jgi:hypothetical protein